MQQVGPQAEKARHTAPQLFDRFLYRKNLKRRDFKELAPFYELVAQELIDRLSLIKRNFKQVVQIGSLGPGDEMLREWFEGNTHLLLDEEPSIPHTILADAEFLPLAAGSTDLIISCLTHHYTNDIVGAFKQIQLALKPDGFFQGIVLGGNSLKELHECMYKVSQENLGGISPLMPPLLTPQECGYLLKRTGFTLPVVDRFCITVFYEDLWMLLHDIQKIGQASPLYSKGFLGKDFLKKVLQFYNEAYTTDQGIPVTLDLIFLGGFKFHPSQPTTLKPGSAQKSLTEALS